MIVWSGEKWFSRTINIPRKFISILGRRSRTLERQKITWHPILNKGRVNCWFKCHPKLNLATIQKPFFEIKLYICSTPTIFEFCVGKVLTWRQSRPCLTLIGTSWKTHREFFLKFSISGSSHRPFYWTTHPLKIMSTYSVFFISWNFEKLCGWVFQ